MNSQSSPSYEGYIDPCMCICFPCLFLWSTIEVSCKGCVRLLCCSQPKIENDNNL